MADLNGEARTLLARGEAHKAFTRLGPFERAYAGDNEFDLLLGTAAVDVGEYDRAVLVLQRVLLDQPGNAAARMELGRAYFGLGDMELARQEFELLMRQNPPQQAAVLIERYLEKIRQAESVYKPIASHYLELEAGYNNNANGATDVSSFLGFMLDEQSRETPSAIYGAAVGGNLSRPLRPRWQALTAYRASYRNYPAAEFIDTMQGAVAAHLQRKRGDTGFRLGILGQVAALDQRSNNRVVALDGAWWAPVADQWLVRATARIGATRYAGQLAVRDVNNGFLGVSLLVNVPGRRNLRGELTLIGGIESGQTDNILNNRPFGRDIRGIRLASSFVSGQILQVSTAFGWLQSNYDGPFAGDDGNQRGRLDDQMTLSIAFVLSGISKFPHWTLRNELRYIRNDSDITLHEYSSAQILTTLRRELH